jgi:hypothetical protein
MPTTDFGQWKPRDPDLCLHCGHQWHGLPCTAVSPVCHCLGAIVLGQAPEEKD